MKILSYVFLLVLALSVSDSNTEVLINGQVTAWQPVDAELTAIAGLTSAANKLPYFTGSGAADVTDLSAYMRGIIDDANEATLHGSINLEIGTDVLAEQTIGILDDNLLEVDDAGNLSSGDYAKVTANGIEGRDYSEVVDDIGSSIDETGTVATGTWASNITIGVTETVSMGDPTSLADGQYNGETIEIEAGEALVVYDLCYVKHHATDPEAWKVDASTLATVEAQIVMCLEATLADGVDGTFLVAGYIREDDWTWTYGDIWNSTTAGSISQSEPAVADEYAKIIGHAWTGDIMRFHPAENYIKID